MTQYLQVQQGSLNVATDINAGVNINAGGQFNGSGAGLTVIPRAALAADIPNAGKILLNDPVTGLMSPSAFISQTALGNVSLSGPIVQVQNLITFDALNKNAQKAGAVLTTDNTPSTIFLITIADASAATVSFELGGYSTTDGISSVALTGVLKAVANGGVVTASSIGTLISIKDAPLATATVQVSSLGNDLLINVVGVFAVNMSWTGAVRYSVQV